MGDYGKVEASEYAQRPSREAIEQFEDVVSEWLATGPGSFSSRHCVAPYRTAHDSFLRWASRPIEGFNSEFDFEIALARAGYRAGVLAYDGDPLWLLILPSRAKGA